MPEHMDLEHLEVVDLNNLGRQWAVVAVDMAHHLKQHMACHLKTTITTLSNKTTILLAKAKSNNSSISTTTQDSNQCQNIAIKATWNIKLQPGTKTNTARKTALKATQTANQLHQINILTKTLHK